MSKNKNEHLHRYKKVNIGRNGNVFFVYVCTKAHCTHYIALHLAEGKQCECNRCYQPMIMDRNVLKAGGKDPMVKPHCPKCTRKRKTENVNASDAIAAFLSGNKI